MAKRKREIRGVMRRYEWKLYPTLDQRAALERQCRLAGTKARDRINRESSSTSRVL